MRRYDLGNRIGMFEVIKGRIIDRLKTELFWRKIEGDKTLSLSIEYYLARDEEDREKMMSIRAEAAEVLSYEDYQRFWSYADKLADRMLDEEIKSYLEEKKEDKL